MPTERDAMDGFDEARYLAAYPDVAAAVAAGQLSSGRFHFDHFGRAEGRRADGAKSHAEGVHMRVDPFSTHQALLTAALLNTRGPILEMGGGSYSTPLVSAFANSQRREAHTMETNPAIYGWLRHFASPFHNTWLVSGYDFVDGGFTPRPHTTRAEYIAIQSRFLADLCKERPQQWSVVFIDQAPGYLRLPAIEHFSDSADFIVVHDTEVDAYGYEPCLSTFRYRWESCLQVPHTTIVSNLLPCDRFASLLGQASPA